MKALEATARIKPVLLLFSETPMLVLVLMLMLMLMLMLLLFPFPANKRQIPSTPVSRG